MSSKRLGRHDVGEVKKLRSELETYGKLKVAFICGDSRVKPGTAWTNRIFSRCSLGVKSRYERTRVGSHTNDDCHKLLLVVKDLAQQLDENRRATTEVRRRFAGGTTTSLQIRRICTQSTIRIISA